MGAEELRTNLRHYLASQEDVASASLVGSFATGKARPDSDVDVLVVFSRPTALDPLASGRRKIELAGDLEGVAGRRVDVIVLDACSPVLAFHVLQHQSVILDRDRDRRLEAEVRQIALYQDLSETRDQDLTNYLKAHLA